MVNIAIDIAHIWTQNIKGNMYLYDYVKKQFNKYVKKRICFCNGGSGIWIQVLCLSMP